MSVPPVSGGSGSPPSPEDPHVIASRIASGDTIEPVSLLDYLSTIGSSRLKLKEALDKTASEAASMTDPYYKVLIEAYRDPSGNLFNQIASIYEGLRSRLIFATNRAVEISEQDETTRQAIVLPPSFATRTSPVTPESGATGNLTGPGTSGLLAASSLGLGDRNLQRILSSALYKAVSVQAQIQISEKTLEQLKILSLGLIDRAARSAAEPTVRQLSENTVAAGNSNNAVEVSGAVSFANNSLSFSSAPEIEGIIKDILSTDENFTKLSAEDKESLLKQFTAAFKIGILNVALAQVSHAIGLSGLSAQILGNVQGNNNPVTVPSEININQVLDNPISLEFLINSLTKALSTENAGVPPTPAQAPSISSDVQQIVNKALILVLLNPFYKNTQDLKDALLGAFLNQGVSEDTAAKLAGLTVSIIRSEVTLPPLDKYLINERLETLANVVAPVEQPAVAPAPVEQPPVEVASVEQPVVAQAATPPQEPVEAPRPRPVNIPTLQTALLSRLKAEFDRNTKFLPALREVLSDSLTTVRELRSYLLDQLLAKGVRAEEATRFTDLVVLVLTTPQPEPSPQELEALHNAVPQRIVPLPNLAEDLSIYLQSQLTKELDTYRAGVLTDKTIRTLIGANSILSEYNNQIRVLRERSNQDFIQSTIDFNQRRKALDEAIAQGLTSITRPSLPLYALRQEVSEIIHSEITRYMDPLAQDTLARSSPGREPTNFKRNIDIRI